MHYILKKYTLLYDVTNPATMSNVSLRNAYTLFNITLYHYPTDFLSPPLFFSSYDYQTYVDNIIRQ